MVSASSGMTRASRSRMPASFSPVARKARFASWVRPDRISLPMIRTQAVTTSAAGSASLIGSSESLLRFACAVPSYGKAARPHNKGLGMRLVRIAGSNSPPYLRSGSGHTRRCRLLTMRLSPGACGHAPLRQNEEHSLMQQDLMPGLGLMRGVPRSGQIKIHGPDAFEGMRQAGQLAAATLDFVTPHVRPGITTGELDRLCHGFIIDHDAIPATLNYRGYPKSLCTSINHVVCHGIPGDRKLEDGDILNIDVTVILDGWHGDSSRMYCAGVPSTRARNLIDITFQSFLRGIELVRR